VNVAGLENSDLDTVRRVPALVEAKNVGDWTWTEIPQHYQLQGQWSMAVGGFGLTFFVVLHGGRRLDTYELEADPAVQAELIEEAEAFWRCVESGEPPAAESGDLVFLSALFPQSHEQAVEIPVEAVAELYDSRRHYVAALERKEDAEAAVKAMLADADTAVSDQSVIATWKTNSRRGIDVGRLKAELPHVADRYTVKTTERRFLVKGEER
jgi:predicted phage-related endonuclease